MYCLIEILSPEILREYKFNDEDSIITEELLNISDNKEEAYQLMTSLKSIDLYDNLMGIEEEKIENYRRIYDGFAYFYKAKYHKDMENDKKMLIYLYNTPALTKEQRQKVNDFLKLPKETQTIKWEAQGYFAKDYIKAHPHVKVMYGDRGITIDEHNRYNSFDRER